MPTTVELVSAFIDVQAQKEEYERADEVPDIEYEESLQDQENEITDLIMTKSDSIHWFLTQIDVEEGHLKGAAEAHEKQLNMLNKKMISVERARNRMKELIMLTVGAIGQEQENGNKVLKTSTNKYTVYETDGPLEVLDSSQIPNLYYKLERKLDRKRLRNDLKGRETDENFARVPKVKRLKIS
jgi:hypothetical protein|tara:strand:+ start:511 stop:1062 length:552 start_codon:yes stop_codon:yes gene_type:complete